MRDACNLWVTSTCVHVCLLAEMWGGKGESPFPCSYHSASDGTLALVLHMLNALGGSRWIEMKKAPAVVASRGAQWDGDQSKVTGLQEERLVFCLSALAVEMSDGKGVWRWINSLHLNHSLDHNLECTGGRMETLTCLPRAKSGTQAATLRADRRAGVGPSIHCAWSLRKELYLLFCTVFSQPEFGHGVGRCVLGNGTNGRQAPEGPISVLL